LTGSHGSLAAAGDGAESPPGGAGRAAMLTVRFLVELATLAALAVAGASAGTGLGWRIVLAIGGPVLLAIIWGLVMAPLARRRIADPARLVVEVVLFLLAALALALVGDVVAAVVYGVIAVGAALLTRVLTPGA
jgi:Protein of unknown function (DUF2568)